MFPPTTFQVYWSLFSTPPPRIAIIFLDNSPTGPTITFSLILLFCFWKYICEQNTKEIFPHLKQPFVFFCPSSFYLCWRMGGQTWKYLTIGLTGCTCRWYKQIPQSAEYGEEERQYWDFSWSGLSRSNAVVLASTYNFAFHFVIKVGFVLPF